MGGFFVIEQASRTDGRSSWFLVPFFLFRFAGIHREALRFPRDRFTFFGSDYPSFNLAKATEGEKRVYDKFKVDPYGVHGELKSKLYNRDPFVQGARYTNSCPEMQPLMRYSGRDLYSGRLPWTTPS